MKICIYGAGAIGGYLGAELSLAGEDVTLIARGPHLKAIQENGLKLLIDGAEKVAHPRATASAEEAGPQDYVIIGLKAHSVPSVAEAMQPLIGPQTAIVTAQNGIPWWYFHGLQGPFEGRRLETVDPGGILTRLLPPERCIGCVVYPATEIVEPGVIKHTYGNRFLLGEPDGSKSDRVTALSKAMIAAGFKAPVRPKIRDDIWLKLWGNLSFNPVSALTGATLVQIGSDPETRAVIRKMMEEASAIAERLGVSFAIDIDKRIDGATDVGEHKTSMLQDLELGRPMEIDALVRVVKEMGRLVDVPTPTLDIVLALVSQRAELAGAYRRS